MPLERSGPVLALEMEMCLWCGVLCGVLVVWCVLFLCGLRLPSKRLAVTPAVCPRLFGHSHHVDIWSTAQKNHIV